MTCDRIATLGASRHSESSSPGAACSVAARRSETCWKLTDDDKQQERIADSGLTSIPEPWKRKLSSQPSVPTGPVPDAFFSYTCGPVNRIGLRRRSNPTRDSHSVCSRCPLRPVLSSDIGQGLGVKSFQLLEDPLDHIALSSEQRLGTAGMHATERRLVERGWLHDAPCRELVDNHLDETDLRRGQASVGEELRERLLRGGAVHPHHAPHEMGQ